MTLETFSKVEYLHNLKAMSNQIEAQLKTNRKRKKIPHADFLYSKCISQRNASNIINDYLHWQHERAKGDVGLRNHSNNYISNCVSDSDDESIGGKKPAQYCFYMKNDIETNNYSVCPTDSSQNYSRRPEKKMIKPLHQPTLYQNRKRAKYLLLQTSFQQEVNAHEHRVMHVDYSKISSPQHNNHLNVKSQAESPNRTWLRSQEDLRVAIILAENMSREKLQRSQCK